MIRVYPEFSELTIALRPELHPLFQQVPDGVSEFTFANLYLFRHVHHYQIARLSETLCVVSGHDSGKTFFILPFGFPAPDRVQELFRAYGSMKCVPESQIEFLTGQGFDVVEDRDNFDYLYFRKDLAELAGRKYHKKRNLLKAFVNNYTYEGHPLLPSHRDDALAILDGWKAGCEDAGDYAAAREALELMETLQLCGCIYYVEGQPVAYALGEGVALGTTYVIHFEKAVGGYKGIWQFVNQAFAAILPKKYTYINREQDLGDEGLRQSKLTYFPTGFVKKYRAMWPG